MSTYPTQRRGNGKSGGVNSPCGKDRKGGFDGTLHRFLDVNGLLLSDSGLGGGGRVASES